MTKNGTWRISVGLFLIEIVVLLSFLYRFKLTILLFLIFLAILAVVSKPEWGIYGCAAIRFSEIDYGFSIGRPFLYLLLITAISYGLRFAKQSKFQLIYFLKNNILIIFVFWGCISILCRGNYESGFENLILWLKNIILFLLITNILTKKSHIIQLIVVIIFVLALGISYDFLFRTVRQISGFYVLNRMRGFSDDPNVFAITSILVMPINFKLFMYYPKLWHKITLGFSFILFLLGVIFSYSRGAFIGFLSAVFFLLFERGKIKKNLMIFILIILIISQFLPPQYWIRIKTISNIRSDMSIFYRFRLLKATLTMFSENPLVGVGWGNFMHISPKYTGIHRHYRAHNMYFEILAEMGLIGLCIFGAIIIMALKDFSKSKKLFYISNNYQMASISSGLMIGLIGFLVSGFFLSIQQHRALIFVFALSSVLKKLARDEG